MVWSIFWIDLWTQLKEICNEKTLNNFWVVWPLLCIRITLLNWKYTNLCKVKHTHSHTLSHYLPSLINKLYLSLKQTYCTLTHTHKQALSLYSTQTLFLSILHKSTHIHIIFLSFYLPLLHTNTNSLHNKHPLSLSLSLSLSFFLALSEV